MTHAILVQNKVAAMDVDSYNRPAVQANDNLDNGWLVSLPTRDTSATYGQTEVWDATKPATATLAAMWMVYEPEVVLTVSGSHQYKGIDPDPRDFYTPAGTVFTAYQPKVGDIIALTDDALGGTKSTNTFVVATNADYKLNWSASAISGLSYSYLGDSYVSLGLGDISTQRVTTRLFTCVAVS